MAQKFLNRPEVGAGIEHVSGKCMTKRVRMNLQPLGKPADVPIDDVADAAYREPSAAAVKEHGLRRGPVSHS